MNNHYNKNNFKNPSINIMRLNKPHSPQTTSLELFNPHPPPIGQPLRRGLVLLTCLRNPPSAQTRPPLRRSL